MTDVKRNKSGFVVIKTGVGIAKYPWLTRPDTKYSTDGDFKLDLRLTPKEAQEITDTIDMILEEAFQEYKKAAKGAVKKKMKLSEDKPYFMEEDPESGDETGNMILRFKQTAVIRWKDKKTGEPKERKMVVHLFDAKGNEVTKQFAKSYVGGGSEVRVFAHIRPYMSQKDKAVGVTLKLEAVKIITLVGGSSGDSRTASDYAFDEEEDGFEGTPLQDETPVTDNEAPTDETTEASDF